MKKILLGVKKTMGSLNNETIKNHIFEERKCLVESEQYANDINTTKPVKGKVFMRIELREQQRGSGIIMDNLHNFPRKKIFNFSLEPWEVPHRQEDYDHSWLDQEIEQEEDERMKKILLGVRKTMGSLDNETIKNHIFEERKCLVESEQYANDINTTKGFEVGEYPYLDRHRFGSLITRYYCPPDTTITDYELEKLTSFVILAIAQYNSTHETEFGNVLVIKAMTSSSCGHWHYLTFEANLPDHPPQIFQVKVHEEPNWVSSPVFVEFVRQA
ncbi:hypothetical protein AgCh_013180 [Apium graveolens]